MFTVHVLIHIGYSVINLYQNANSLVITDNPPQRTECLTSRQRQRVLQQARRRRKMKTRLIGGDWGGSAWYDWRSKQKIRKLKTPNKTIPWSWADFSQEEEDPLNSSLTPMDWLPRLNAKAGMVEVGCFDNFPIHSVFGKVLKRQKAFYLRRAWAAKYS